MNRSLFVPAVGCLVAFTLVYGTLRRVNALDQNEKAAGLAPVLSPAPVLAPAPDAAKLALTALRDEYVQHWQQWEQSSHRLMSRAGPRSLAPNAVELVLNQESADPDSPFLVATILLRRGSQVQVLPCVVDRAGKQARIFDAETWLTKDEWLQTAASPKMAIHR